MNWLTPAWPAPANVRAASTMRSGGVSTAPYDSLNLGSHVGDAPEAVEANRRHLRTTLQLHGEPCWLQQVHGTRVRNLDGVQDGAPADAAVTHRAGTVCAILTADCLPVLLASESGDCVAAAHAGWRGLAAGVIEAAVHAMHAPPANLLAWLGPAIGPHHFEIGAEVRDDLMRADPGATAAFVANDRGRFMADLSLLARRRLMAVGVVRIFGAESCTHADGTRYFSHRRDGRTGRQASLIWLESIPAR